MTRCAFPLARHLHTVTSRLAQDPPKHRLVYLSLLPPADTVDGGNGDTYTSTASPRHSITKQRDRDELLDRGCRTSWSKFGMFPSPTWPQRCRGRKSARDFEGAKSPHHKPGRSRMPAGYRPGRRMFAQCHPRRLHAAYPLVSKADTAVVPIVGCSHSGSTT